jgi:hypothetical protein
MTSTKKRWVYLVVILINIPVGLATRRYGRAMPDLVAEYGGDVFAATCILFGVRFLFPQLALWKVALWSYLVCISIETLQLYHAPWIEKVRHTPPFGILLGYGFLWSDWVCYAVGTAMALAICWMIERTGGSKAPNL